uniref:Uncharacterized protein n=1 Tax=Takifugu rubripes TaxID=31033 RepID=A0A674P1D9_TAKRU
NIWGTFRALQDFNPLWRKVLPIVFLVTLVPAQGIKYFLLSLCVCIYIYIYISFLPGNTKLAQSCILVQSF